MKRTNEKDVRNAVNSYVMDCIEADAETNGRHKWQTIQDVNDGFEVWKRNGETLQNYLTNIYGLFTYYYDEERELLKQWLQETDAEAERYDNNQVNELFKILTAREYQEIDKAEKIARETARVYDLLYDNYPVHYEEIVDSGDSLIKKLRGKKLLENVIRLRGDYISSDREVAAFYVSYMEIVKGKEFNLLSLKNEITGHVDNYLRVWD